VNVTIFDPDALPQRIRIEGSLQESKLIQKIAPAHRSGAGVVRLLVVVGKDGSVIQVDPLDGPQPLIYPAIDAVKQWKYRPTLLNGHPVEVLTNVAVDF
jgi:protein TonB